MEPGIPEIKKTAAEPLRPMVVSIPESNSNPTVSSLPAVLERLLKTAAANRATEVLIEKKPGWSRIRERIRGILITDLRAGVSEADIPSVFDFVSKAQEPKKEGGLKWSEFHLQTSLNSEPYNCRFLLSETKDLSVVSIHLTKTSDGAFNPASWGMGPNQAQILESFLGRSHGLVLFCGTDADPVTPIIQACAKHLGTPERHLIAVSSRPEPWSAGVEHFVSNGDPELFSRFLKVGFRHEPDLLIADAVSSKEHIVTCLAEALRGRLVFARLHATDAADALLQVLAMGAEPYMIGAALMGIVAQRTLRLNCQKCQEKDVVSRDRLKDLGIPVGMQPSAFFHGAGCDNCLKTGFDRETNIFEVFEMNDEFRVRLNPSMKSEAFRSAMKTSGLMTLRQIALHKAINGQTSLSEVFRITQ